jgi:hypothetical protein
MDKFPHYWLCSECADAKGGKWPEGHVATVTHGECPYCKTPDVTIIPYVDFDWPDLKTKHLRD